MAHTQTPAGTRERAPREGRGNGKTEYSAYTEFSRDDWSRLRSNTPLTLSQDDLHALRGVTEQVSMQDVVDVYLPLSRLLSCTSARHAASAA